MEPCDVATEHRMPRGENQRTKIDLNIERFFLLWSETATWSLDPREAPFIGWCGKPVVSERGGAESGNRRESLWLSKDSVIKKKTRWLPPGIPIRSVGGGASIWRCGGKGQEQVLKSYALLGGDMHYADNRIVSDWIKRDVLESRVRFRLSWIRWQFVRAHAKWSSDNEGHSERRGWYFPQDTMKESLHQVKKKWYPILLYRYLFSFLIDFHFSVINMAAVMVLLLTYQTLYTVQVKMISHSPVHTSTFFRSSRYLFFYQIRRRLW